MKKIYLSENANKKLSEYIESLGYEIEYISSKIDSAIGTHPDLYIASLGSELYFGDAKKLSSAYPGDVLYNATSVGKYFLCSKYTDEDLISKAKSLGLEIIKCRQGYVKCNVVILDDTHIITEDIGIVKSLEETEIDCLLIESGYVKLESFPYGFIGGASGKLGETIIFNGDLSSHPDFEKIKRYVESCNLKIKYFPDYPLEDIGSIIS